MSNPYGTTKMSVMRSSASVTERKNQLNTAGLKHRAGSTDIKNNIISKNNSNMYPIVH